MNYNLGTPKPDLLKIRIGGATNLQNDILEYFRLTGKVSIHYPWISSTVHSFKLNTSIVELGI